MTDKKEESRVNEDDGWDDLFLPPRILVQELRRMAFNDEHRGHVLNLPKFIKRILIAASICIEKNADLSQE